MRDGGTLNDYVLNRLRPMCKNTPLPTPAMQGILLYMGLVDLVANDFFSARMRSAGRRVRTGPTGAPAPLEHSLSACVRSRSRPVLSVPSDGVPEGTARHTHRTARWALHASLKPLAAWLYLPQCSLCGAEQKRGGGRALQPKPRCHRGSPAAPYTRL